MASRTPQFTSSRAPDHPSRRTPRLQTTGQSSRSQTRYSYLETPVEMQRSTFAPFSSPTNSTIDESPVSALSPSRGLPEYSQHERATPLPDEKAFEASMQAPPTQMHPAFNAPVIAESASTPRQASIPRQNTQAMAPPNPPQSPGPLPIKSDRDYSQMATPMTTSTATPDLKGAETAPLDSYNPHALQGPNVSTANHRPGQVSHPNAIVDPHWKHGLCEPDTSCCMGLLCPCVLYGRTMYRLSRKAERKDPTEMLGYESCNGSCGLFALGCGIQGILAAIHRTRIRKLYKIDGSFGSDCLKGLCCCCCVVAQNEREVKDREELIRRHAGPVAGAYVAPSGGMTYAPPPR